MTSEVRSRSGEKALSGLMKGIRSGIVARLEALNRKLAEELIPEDRKPRVRALRQSFKPCKESQYAPSAHHDPGG